MASVIAAKGSFRKGEKKTDKSPDWIGSIEAKEDIRRGQKLYVGVWKNTGDRGETYYSINVTFPEQRERPAARPATAAPRNTYAGDDLDDEIPF